MGVGSIPILCFGGNRNEERGKRRVEGEILYSGPPTFRPSVFFAGMVDWKRLNHPDLIIEKRSRMKIMLFDPEKDLPLNTIVDVLQHALNLDKNGTIKLGTY